MSGPVHIVALGARTPLGLTAESSAAAVRGRISRLAEHPHAIDLRGDPVRCARDELVPPLASKDERLLAMSRAALGQVVAELKALLGGGLPGRIPLLVAVGEARFGWENQQIAKLGRKLAEDPGGELGGAIPEILPAGHAGSIEALKSLLVGFAERRHQLCILGGVDSNVDNDSLLWIDSNGRLAADGVRAGFAPGEGAAFLALASSELVTYARLQPLASVRGVGVARESRGRLSSLPAIGKGLSAAIAEACSTLGPGELVDATFNDINGERHRTEEWGFSLLRNQARFARNEYVTAVGEWGDVGAASAVLGMVLATQAFRRGYARGPRSLVWASSDGGLRGAVVLQQAW